MTTTKPIIEIKHLGKRYDIANQRGGYIALRDVLANVFRSPFSFLKSKAKKVVGLEKKEAFWALRDISFDVTSGEVIGIIGGNGAGKSTLLKILTGITPPTEGEAIMHGRVSSLLEVGTGFHPELTGRENIFLNGAILGMTKKEIARKFDEIVAFSGVEKFLDTPVKHYSSGMQVRLAFSVAAHMEPDILIVDEVLAVGDAEFQKKCMGKMEEVTKKEGRTILFVSHNMTAIKNLCPRTILLENGRIKMIDSTEKVIDYYLNESAKETAVTEFPVKKTGGVKAFIQRTSVLRHDGVPSTKVPISEPFSIEVEYEVFEPLTAATISVGIYRNGELLLLSSSSDKEGILGSLEPGKYKTKIHFPSFLFNVGNYFFEVLIHRPMMIGFDRVQDLYFEITDTHNPRSIVSPGHHPGTISSILEHKTYKLD